MDIIDLISLYLFGGIVLILIGSAIRSLIRFVFFPDAPQPVVEEDDWTEWDDIVDSTPLTNPASGLSMKDSLFDVNGNPYGLDDDD